MTTPTKAEVDRLFQDYSNAEAFAVIPKKEIAKKKILYLKAYNSLLNHNLKGGA